jgi:serine/threonine protein kinase
MDHRYILFKQIARGGMAEIYLGKQIGEDGFQRICCIKRILPSYANEDEFVKMFRDEAHICKRLQHANIVRVEGFEEVEGSYAIIMEFVVGSDLRNLLVKCEQIHQQLPIPCALYIAAESARGLHYAHTKLDDITGKPIGIIHRDVSPQNIIVSFEGEIKITDFGIADANTKATETQPGIVKGKYAYMSPEQISAQPLDARTDIFALSIILWEMLAMRRLFQGDNEIETIQHVKTCYIPHDLQQLNPLVEDELAGILAKGLHKNPNMRYLTAQEFEKTLRQYINKRYPDFTPEDLSKLMKSTLAERKLTLQDHIRQLLQDTQAPLELTLPADEAPPTSAPQTKSATSSQTQLKKRKKSSIAPILASLFLLTLFLGGGIFYLITQKEKKGNLELHTTPERVALKIDGQSLQQGRYVTTPIQLSLPQGPHTVEISRPGYAAEPHTFDVQEGTVKKEIVLREQKPMAPLRIRITSKEPKSYYVIIDSGLEASSISSQHYWDVIGILFGEKHIVEIYSDSTKSKMLMDCSFTPRAQSWQAPFVVDADLEKKRCAYPLY